MWTRLFILVFQFLSFSSQTDELVKTMKSLNTLINPNDWSHNDHYEAKERIDFTPYGPYVDERGCFEARRTSEKTAVGYETVRRFINLLLKKAYFEDVAGNTVPLDSISSSKESKLFMSFVTSASPKEIQFLVEFGQKKTDAYMRQVDEVLTNLISTEEPDFIWCNLQKSFWNWTKGIGNTWYAITSGIDLVVVLFLTTIAYVIWSVKASLRRGFSWKNIALCFLLPSIFWEFSRLLEEEKLKQYSEELRLGNIPAHCVGMDNRGWWEVVLSRSPKVVCYEHHLVKSGHPALRISIFKVAVVHLQQLLSVVTTFIKDLTASSPDDGFVTSIIMRIVAWLSVTVIGVASIFLFSQSFMFRMASSLTGERAKEGSRVELLEPATEGTVRAPPRQGRRHGGKRLRGEEQVDGSVRNTIIYKIISHNVHLVSGGGQPPGAVLHHQGGGGSGDATPMEEKSLSLPSPHNVGKGSSDEESGGGGEEGGGGGGEEGGGGGGEKGGGGGREKGGGGGGEKGGEGGGEEGGGGGREKGGGGGGEKGGGGGGEEGGGGGSEKGDK